MAYLPTFLKHFKKFVLVEQLQPGDILYFQRLNGLYNHCAIYFRRGYVIHFNVDPKESSWHNVVGYLKGWTEIRLDQLRVVAGDSPVYLIRMNLPVQIDARREKVEMALERVGERSYSWHSHNCHHLCQEITGIEIPSDKHLVKRIPVELGVKKADFEVNRMPNSTGTSCTTAIDIQYTANRTNVDATEAGRAENYFENSIEDQSHILYIGRNKSYFQYPNERHDEQPMLNSSFVFRYDPYSGRLGNDSFAYTPYQGNILTENGINEWSGCYKDANMPYPDTCLTANCRNGWFDCCKGVNLLSSEQNVVEVCTNVGGRVIAIQQSCLLHDMYQFTAQTNSSAEQAAEQEDSYSGLIWLIFTVLFFVLIVLISFTYYVGYRVSVKNGSFPGKNDIKRFTG